MQNKTSGWNVGSLHLVVCFNWKMSRFNWVMLKLKMSHPCNVTSLCRQMWPKSPKMFHLVCVYRIFSTSKCVGTHERCFFFPSIHLDCLCCFKAEAWNKNHLRAELWDNNESIPAAHAVLSVVTENLSALSEDVVVAWWDLLLFVLHQFR